MPTHYDDDEYKGSEHATDVFKAPTPEPIPETEGQKLERRPEDYIDTGELNEDGEPLHWSGWPLHLLGKVGDAFESVDKAVLGKIGTEDANLYTARRGSIDWLTEQNLALGLLGEIFIPDTVDIATAGLAYIPNRFRRLGKAGVKLWAKLNKGSMSAADIGKTRRIGQRVSSVEPLSGRPALAQRRFGPDGLPIDEDLEFALQLSKADEAADAISKAVPVQFTHVPASPSDIYKTTQKLLNENVLVGKDRKFSYSAFKGLLTGDKRGRKIAAYMQTTPHSKIPNWDTHRQGLVDIFETMYGDVMDLKDLHRKDIQIDHLVTLRSTMPIYDDVAFGSPLWNKIQETFLDSKYKPGNTEANLAALDRGSHLMKTNFFNDTIGKDGEKFFNKKMPNGQKRIDYMKQSDENRIEVLKELIEIQDTGSVILKEAQFVWETLYKAGADLPADIVEKLTKIPIGKYTHPELRNLDELRKIVDDIVVAEAQDTIKGINKGYRLLGAKLKNPNLKVQAVSKKQRAAKVLRSIRNPD